MAIESQEFFKVHPAVFHLFDRPSYIPDAISDKLCEKYGEAVLTSALEAWKQLIEDHLPTPLPFTENDIIDCYCNAPITTVNLLVSYQCNMACSYCYSEEVLRQPGGVSLMSSEIAFAAVDYFLESSLKQGFAKVTFKFSGGGEPLMNREIVHKTILYAQNHRLRDQVEVQFKLSTNGILLDTETIAFFKDQPMELKISIDGCKEIHQRRRFSKSGQDNYKKLLENISLALTELSPKRVVAAVTISDPARLQEILNFLLDIGFRRIRTQKAIGPSIQAPSTDKETSSTSSQLFHEYYKTIKKFQEKNLSEDSWPSFESIDLFIEGLNRQQNKRHLACNAGIYDCTVAPDGTIYSCNRFAGDPTHLMGDVFNGIDRGWQDKFCRASNLFNRSKCLDCWLIYWCGGNCNYQNQVETNNMLESSEESCASMKTFFEHAIWFYCKLRRDDPEILKKIVSRKVF